MGKPSPKGEQRRFTAGVLYTAKRMGEVNSFKWHWSWHWAEEIKKPNKPCPFILSISLFVFIFWLLTVLTLYRCFKIFVREQKGWPTKLSVPELSKRNPIVNPTPTSTKTGQGRRRTQKGPPPENKDKQPTAPDEEPSSNRHITHLRWKHV